MKKCKVCGKKIPNKQSDYCSQKCWEKNLEEVKCQLRGKNLKRK